jgi:hypothetical protein
MGKLQEFSLRNPTIPQLTSSNCAPTHDIGLYPKTHGHTHTHTNSHEKFYISFCVLPRLSLSLSLLPFNTSPSQCNPPFKRMPSSPLPNSNLLFQPNSAAQSFVLFSPPEFHSKLWPTLLATSKTSQANKPIDFFIIIIIIFFLLLLLLHTHEIFFFLLIW